MILSPKVHRIYAIVTGVAAVVAGICLIIACIGIWGAGDAPFTPASVEAAFTPISIPVYLCLVLVLGGLVLDTLFPETAEKLRAPRQAEVLLKRQQAKTDIAACGPVLARDIQRLMKKRQWFTILGAAVPALLILIFLGYAVNPGNFAADDPTGSVIKAMYILLPCLAAALVCALVLRKLLVDATEKLIILLKQAPACKIDAPSPAPTKGNRLSALRSILIILAIAMIAYGAISGGTTDVLAKAVNICTECVGLG